MSTPTHRGSRWERAVLAVALLVGPLALVVPRAAAEHVAGPLAYTGAGISSPMGITAGADGNLWFTNRGNNSIGRITPGGVVSNFTDPTIVQPLGIATGGDGNVWFANSGAWTVGRVTPSGQVTEYGGNGAAGPRWMASAPDGAVWFTNSALGMHTVGRVTADGYGGEYSSPYLTVPYGIAVAADGSAWITDQTYGVIVRLVRSAAYPGMPEPPASSVGFSGSGISYPGAIAEGPDGNMWFTNNNAIGRITSAGVVTIFNDPTISLPNGITAGPDGAMWFTNGNNTIGRIAMDGSVTRYVPPGTNGPTGITAGPDGNIWFTNTYGNSIGKVDLAALADPYGEYTAVTPARVFDTRDGTGWGGMPGQVGPAVVRDIQIAGQGGLPATGLTAVVMNVTVTNPSSWGWIRVWPAGTAEPDVSNLNFVAGQTVANQVTVQLGADGKVSLRSANATADVIFDVVGAYADSDGVAGSRFHGIAPVRFVDTRFGVTGPIGPGETLSMDVTGLGGVPATGVTAIALNVTVTQPTSWGWITVHPADVGTPDASSVNFYAGQTVANMAVVRVPADGVISFYNQFGDSEVIVDVAGYYDGDRSTEAGRFLPVTPYRTFDSRTAGGPLEPGSGVALWWTDSSDQPLDWVGAIAVNLTVTEPTAQGWVTAFPLDATEIPWVSNLNFMPGQTVPNMAMVRTSQSPFPAEFPPAAGIAVYNPYGYTQLVVDLFGFFTNANGVPSVALGVPDGAGAASAGGPAVMAHSSRGLG